jgi:GNAT superfamily N-acetyltransferase
MTEFTIRRALPQDADAIAAFNRAMAWETEEKNLAPDVVAAGVRGLLAHPEFGFYLVAEEAGEVVGALLVTMEWSDWRDGLFWWIQSVYVRPTWRRRGVFRRLYGEVRRAALADPAIRGLRLYVDRDNAAARQTYATLGMVATNYAVYEEVL